MEKAERSANHFKAASLTGEGMEHVPLATKLYIPPPRPNLVPRPHLIQRLDEGLRLGHRLTLVCAPAGFGKTTLLSKWVNAGQRAVAWLSLDESDNDPVQFLRYLIAALQGMDPRIGRALQQLLKSPKMPPVPRLAVSLINDVTVADQPLTLVLDDYHLIHYPAVQQLVRFLLENQPPLMHIALSTREDPPLPLPRLRARGQVTEIRERELRFTAEEAAAFLNQTMGLALSPATVAALEARTEGWIAGLQLAALALQEEQDETQAEAFVAAFTGHDRYVTDYLVSEVLERQPATTRDFLRQTAILDRLSAPLCDAVTGRQESQAVLEQLDAANLFLIPLDRRREWYRYYRLFAEVLRATLDPDARATLHRRAARWYEAQGLPGHAVQHALAAASASGDTAAAERLIKAAAEETMQGGGVLTLRGWLAALPDARVRADGALATYQGWVLVLTGEMARAEDYAQAADAQLNQLDTSTRYRGKLLLLRCYFALDRHDYAAVVRLGTQALQVLERDQAHWRVMALWTLAEAQERRGDLTAAIQTLRQAQDLGRTLGNPIFVAVIESSLAAALNLQGRRREAVALCEEAIARYTDDVARSLPMAALIFIRLGMLHYEAHQLALARRYQERGLALSEKYGVSSLSLFAYGALAPTLFAQGEADTALNALQKAYQLGVQEAVVDVDWIRAWQVNLRMRQGDLAFAVDWVTHAGLSLDDPPAYLRLESQLTYARVLLAQGRHAEARRWLARLEDFLRTHGMDRWRITVHILQALVAARGGDHATARTLLARAVEIAAPGDYVRAFLDEGPAALARLRDVRHVAPAFVDQVLEGMGETVATEPAPDTQPLIEPLSERELEVLRLIAAGLTNREIAGELYIALGTVKRHINNLYGKLGVHKRTLAIARARELRLL